ncbi:MAG: hypothetical protein ACRDV9_00255 [Acidimicrobiia bacterium]
MSLSERYQRKSIQQAQVLLGDEVKVLDHAPGYAGPHPYVTVCAIVIPVLLLALLTGRLIGGIPIILAGYAVNKPRGLVLTNQGVTVFKRSVLVGRLTQPIATLPAESLTAVSAPAQMGYLRIPLAAERVWIRDKDQRRMTSGAKA